MTDNVFYTYAWLREDGTPYYIGKGKGQRAWRKSQYSPSPDRVLILKDNLSEFDAFKHEMYMIAVFGRKDIGTGILYNFTDGGDGKPGHVVTEDTRNKMRKPKTPEHAANISKARKGVFVGPKHNWYGKSHTAEANLKNSAAHLGEMNGAFGKHWWVNPLTNEESMSHHPPGSEWIRGRKTR